MSGWKKKQNKNIPCEDYTWTLTFLYLLEDSEISKTTFCLLFGGSWVKTYKIHGKTNIIL